jgi:transcriptional regulator with XRE-family HTH domain
LHGRLDRRGKCKTRREAAVPRSTPKREGRKAPEGARFLEDVLATNVRNYRAIREMDQTELARRMKALGHGWDAGTVGFVERGDRNVTLSEVLALMLVFEKTFDELLDPTGPDGSVKANVDIGFPDGPLAPGVVRDWLRGDEVEFTITEYEPQMKIEMRLVVHPEGQKQYRGRIVRRDER